MQTNFLSHFLMISKLMPEMGGSPDPRVTLVGSVTGNDNTVGGGGVYPVADLKDLEGLAAVRVSTRACVCLVASSPRGSISPLLLPLALWGSRVPS